MGDAVQRLAACDATVTSRAGRNVYATLEKKHNPPTAGVVRWRGIRSQRAACELRHRRRARGVVAAADLRWRCGRDRVVGSQPEASFRGRSSLAANRRVMYIARVMRSAAHEIRDIARAGTPTHGHLRDRLVGLAVATLAVDLGCVGLALLFEHDAKQTQITSFGSALFWTSTQLLTVSSSIQNPISTGGRILDVAMEAYAITIVATLAGSIGAFMIKRARELEHDAEQN
jgi:hypothetical protein